MSERVSEIRARTGTCFKCGFTSDAEELLIRRRFGKPYCRKCHNAYLRDWRTRQTKPRPRNPVVDSAARRRYAQKYPERYAAWTAVLLALRKGQLVKPKTCQHCGEVARLEGHHHDYRKHLEVEWLCRKCHRVQDGRIAA